MCLETLQWWQTWGRTKDLELAILVLDFIPLSHFSDWGIKTVLDPEAVEEEGLEEIAYPKPVLSELGFWALKTSSSIDVRVSKTLSLDKGATTMLNLGCVLNGYS